MGFGNSFENSFGSGGFFVVVREEEQSWVLLLEDLFDGSVIEWHDVSEGVFFNESFKVFGGENTREIVTSFIEFLEEND